MFTAPWGAAQLLAMAENAEHPPLRTTITVQRSPDYATVVVIAGGHSSTTITTTTRATDPLHARHRQLEAELYSLLNTSKTNGRSLETVVPAAIVQDDQSLEPAVPKLSTGSNMDIEVAEPLTASIQTANSTDADAAIATNDVAAATPSDADEDLLDDDDPLMDADSDELCDICENCGHRPAAWELGGRACWECFRDH